MIPVAFPSASFYLMLALSFVAGLVLVGWWCVLALSKRARAAFGRHPVRWGLCMSVLAVLAAFDVWVYAGLREIERDIAQRQAAKHFVLGEAMTLGGIGLPVGTRLELDQADEPATFVRAELPDAVTIAGVSTTLVLRQVQREYDDAYAVRRVAAERVTLVGSGAQAAEGWRCDATAGIEFNAGPDEAPAGLYQCQLAAGNLLDGRELPAGARLLATGGTRYVDGYRAEDRWRVDLSTGSAIELRGLLIDGPSIYLDASPGLVRIESGELVCPLDLGGIAYPAGTRVRSAGRDGMDARAWVFSPREDAPARRDGQDDVTAGTSVVQRPDGEVLALRRNEEVGVFDFMTLVVEGAPPRPTRSACPAQGK
ncbi:hypothetical protein ACILG0_13630 [Pseudomonadota bacterium AL_CKDN230030165-1A_HGKHYDSX7]